MWASKLNLRVKHRPHSLQTNGFIVTGGEAR